MMTQNKIILGGRQSGRTTQLIKESEKTGYPIICSHEAAAQSVKKRAAEIGCVIPDPIALSLQKITNGSLEREISGYNGVLVDELDYLINSIFSGKFAGGVINDEFITDILKLNGGVSESRITGQK